MVEAYTPKYQVPDDHLLEGTLVPHKPKSLGNP